MKTRWLSITAVAASLLFLGVSAASAGGPVQKRQRNQMNRIHQGVKQGNINRGERIRLQREQQRIRNYRSGALADGRYTRQEDRRIDRMQDRASRHIYGTRHNESKYRRGHQGPYPQKLHRRPQSRHNARHYHAHPYAPEYHYRSYPACRGDFADSRYAFELSLSDPGFFIGRGAQGCR